MPKEKSTDPDKMSRRQQFVETYRMAKRTDKAIGRWVLGTFVVGAAVGFGLFWVLPPRGGLFDWSMAVIGGLLFGLLGALIIFGRRAQRAAYGQMEGQPGAAASALNTLRRGWKVDAVVAFNKQQDVVHRVVGPPGIILVGEGNVNRLRPLLTSERRKHERVTSETPIYEIVVGNGEGQIPLPKLVKRVQKLKRALRGGDLTDVLNRIKALDAHRSNIPLPKGPVPNSMKGLRGQMRGR